MRKTKSTNREVDARSFPSSVHSVYAHGIILGDVPNRASFGLDLSHICKRHYFTGEVISGNRALADLPAHLVQSVGGSFNERLEGPLSPGVEGTHAPK